MSMNKNETLIFSYECTRDALNEIANYIEHHELNLHESIVLLRECAEQLEAQSKVVEIREDIRIGKI